jgi:hypothetical protein
MLQVLHMNVAKVDRGVAHVALQAFVQNVSSVFQTHVAGVLTWMFYMFYTYVAKVCSKCFICFQFYVVASVFMLEVAKVFI